MSTEQPAPQAQDSQVSIEERAAAALFGSPERPKKIPAPNIPATPEPEEAEAPQPEEVEQEAASDDAPQAPETFEFDMDGEKFVLPKKLEKSFMQEREFTQKSQELALQRKQTEYIQEQARIANFRQEFEKEVANELSQLQAYDSVLSQPLRLEGMSEGEATKLFLQRAQWKEEREALARSINGKHQQWAQKTEAALKDLQTKADETVRQRVPNWNADTWKAITEHAKNDGYSDVELNSINDPRHKLTLWKAQQYDSIKSKAAKSVVEAKTLKTTPSNPMPQAVKDKLNFRKQIERTAPNSIERKNAVEARAGALFAKR